MSADPATPVTVTVGPDTASITNSINNFVTEYNTVVGDINTQFTVSPTTSTEGPLGSDTDLRILQSTLAADITYATTDSTSVSSGFNNLAAIGITENDDGTLTVDSSTLTNALTSNPAAVQNFFTNSNSAGFADNMNTDLTNLTDPVNGILNQDLASNQSQQNDVNTEITNFQTQLTAQAAQLTQEFDQVNANLEEYPFTLAEVNAALGTLTTLDGSTGTPTTATRAQVRLRPPGKASTVPAARAAAANRRGDADMNIQQSYREAAVRGASSVALVVRLYEQAIEDMRQVVIAIGQNDIQRRSDRIKHALLVIGHLQSSLDFVNGGKVAKDLENFYNVLRQNVIQVQFRPARRAVTQVITDLLAVRQAWIKVEQDQNPSSSMATAPATTATTAASSQLFHPIGEEFDTDSLGHTWIGRGDAT